MTLPASGAISTDQIMTELRIATPGRAYPISTLDADVLALAGKTAGQPVKIPDDLWGKSVGGGFTATGYNAEQYADTSANGSQVFCNPYVIASGGSGNYSYLWEMVSNPGAFSLTGATQQGAGITKGVIKGSQGDFTATLRCTVTDTSNGATIVVNNITARLYWSNGTGA